MKITADLKNEFWHWMNENWNLAGGLITHSIAASMMGKTQTRVRQMIEEGKLKEYRFKTKKFVSFTEVLNLTRNEAYADLQNASALLFKEGAEMFSKIIEKQMKTGKHGNSL
ncbi:hypothetical protein [uncultured Victivallis sp.]|uniref:hypothetical protein n=1 Tax=uncultured Victivallis sp. TaxID=354118 RepID=UPI00258CA514|nr:hypothetical protein [uncultured Victivallis sp.]